MSPQTETKASVGFKAGLFASSLSICSHGRFFRISDPISEAPSSLEFRLSNGFGLAHVQGKQKC
jgi:hypothetical protein